MSEMPSLRQIVNCKDYLRFWSGQTVSQIGDAIALVGLPLLALEVGGSLASVALTFFVGAFAWLAVCPLAGVVADRTNRYVIVIVADGIRAVFAFTLTAVTDEWQLYFVVFALAALEAIFRPAQAAIIPSLLPAHFYQRAIGWSYAAFQGSKLLGFAIAAALLAGGTSNRALFLIDSASFGTAAFLSFLIAMRRDVSDQRLNRAQNVALDLTEGANALLSRPSCVAFTALAGVITFVQPLIAVAMLRSGLECCNYQRSESQTFSMLIILNGLASIFGSLLATRWKALANSPQFSAILVFSTGLTLLASVPFSPIWIGIGAYGISCGAIFASTGAHMAANIPDQRRGRVYALINAFMYLASAAGAIIAFRLNDIPSARVLAIAGASLALGAAIIWHVSEIKFKTSR